MVVGLGGSPQPVLREGGTAIGAAGFVPPDAGAVHFWLAPPVQLQIWVGVPLAELLSTTSRHLSACGLTMSCAAVTVHFWLVPPVHDHNWMRAPLAVDLPV